MQGKEDRKSKGMESKLEKRQEAEVRRSVGDAGTRRQEERQTGSPQEGEREMGREEGGGLRAIAREKAQQLGSQLGKDGDRNDGKKTGCQHARSLSSCLPELVELLDM